MSSLLYKNAYLYEWLLSAFHFGSWGKRYQLMSELIGKNKKVLDLGCGGGITAKFLDRSCEYTGIEENPKFVNHARKKKLNIIQGNLFDINFPKVDVVVISDVLHHVYPNHEKLLEKSLKAASILIICEPDHNKGALNFLGRNKLFFRFFGDNDGINTFESMSDWDYSEEEFKNLLEKFGKVKIYQLGNSFIAKVTGWDQVS